MLYFVDGLNAVKKQWKAAFVTGLVLSLSALFLSFTKLVPVEVIGVLSGLLTMFVAYFIYRGNGSEKVRFSLSFWKSSSPWLFLFVFSLVVNYPPIKKFLADLPGNLEVINVVGGKKIDLNVFAHVYFWILMALVLSLPILKPTKEQFLKAFKVWISRVWGPFIAYSLFFAVAFIMAWTGMEIVNGKLVPSSEFNRLNMDFIIGKTFADVFGNFYPLVSPFLGLLGAFIGGSETASNVLFAKIQYGAVASTIGVSMFMAVYGAHAVAGGIASAITPSKITNAAALVGLKSSEESKLLKILLPPILALTLTVGIILQLIVILSR